MIKVLSTTPYLQLLTPQEIAKLYQIDPQFCKKQPESIWKSLYKKYWGRDMPKLGKRTPKEVFLNSHVTATIHDGSQYLDGLDDPSDDDYDEAVDRIHKATDSSWKYGDLVDFRPSRQWNWTYIVGDGTYVVSSKAWNRNREKHY